MWLYLWLENGSWLVLALLVVAGAVALSPRSIVLAIGAEIVPEARGRWRGYCWRSASLRQAWRRWPTARIADSIGIEQTYWIVPLCWLVALPASCCCRATAAWSPPAPECGEQRMQTIDLLRLRLEMEFGAPVEGDTLPPALMHADGQPRFIVSKRATGYARFYRHDLPPDVLTALEQLPPTRASTTR